MLKGRLAVLTIADDNGKTHDFSSMSNSCHVWSEHISAGSSNGNHDQLPGDITVTKNNASIENIRGLSTPLAAQYLGLSESFLEKSRVNQTKLPGPKATKIGCRVVYLKENLDAYLDNPPSL